MTPTAAAPSPLTSAIRPDVSRRAVIVPAGEGQPVRGFGNEILFMLDGEQTADALTIGLATVPAGIDGPPPHVHEREDEVFIILEGRYRVSVGGEVAEAEAGAVVFLPRGIAHTFQVVGDAPGRHWVITTSGDFGRFYPRAAELFAKPGPPDFARLAALNAEHGMRLG